MERRAVIVTRSTYIGVILGGVIALLVSTSVVYFLFEGSRMRTILVTTGAASAITVLTTAAVWRKSHGLVPEQAPERSREVRTLTFIAFNNSIVSPVIAYLLFRGSPLQTVVVSSVTALGVILLVVVAIRWCRLPPP